MENIDALPSLTIAKFCELEAMSRGFYFLMRKRGEGPAETRSGRMVRISARARAEWHAKRSPLSAESKA
jgi:hypothetical protein